MYLHQYQRSELGFDFGLVSGAISAASGGFNLFSSIFGGGGPTREQKIQMEIQAGESLYRSAMASPSSLKAFIDRACATTSTEGKGAHNLVQSDKDHEPYNGVGYVAGRSGAYASYKVAQQVQNYLSGLPMLNPCSDAQIVYGTAEEGGDCAPYPHFLKKFWQAVCPRRAELYAAIGLPASTGTGMPSATNQGGVIVPTGTGQQTTTVNTPTGNTTVPVLAGIEGNTLLWLGIGAIGLMALSKR